MRRLPEPVNTASAPDDSRAGQRRRIPLVPRWLRHDLVIFAALLIIEYFVVPELIGASKNLHLLSHINVVWLVAGIVLEAGSYLSYAQLTRTLLPHKWPGLFRTVRIEMATTAVAHRINARTVATELLMVSVTVRALMRSATALVAITLLAKTSWDCSR